MNASFILTNAALGMALSMDAFSLSLANGLCYPTIDKKLSASIPLTFAFFQIIMPLIGWFCVHTIVSFFSQLQKVIPLLAMIALLFIGISMLFDAFKPKELKCDPEPLSFRKILVQGIASSLDALSVGFTIAGYTLLFAVIAAFIIGVVTWGICFCGLKFGKLFGLKFEKFSAILGGSILVLIGIKIFVEAVI